MSLRTCCQARLGVWDLCGLPAFKRPAVASPSKVGPPEAQQSSILKPPVHCSGGIYLNVSSFLASLAKGNLQKSGVPRPPKSPVSGILWGILYSSKDQMWQADV